jgi:hypothetical protein
MLQIVTTSAAEQHVPRVGIIYLTQGHKLCIDRGLRRIYALIASKVVAKPQHVFQLSCLRRN